MSATGKLARAAPPNDLPYRIAWRTRDVRGGAHRGTLSGAGGLFRDFVSLLDHPDPRRIDIRATARDPFDTIHVRRFEQKSAIAVYALVDVSASMSFGSPRKLDLAADIVSALAASARHIGDSFGLICCDSHYRPAISVPATRSRSGEAEMIAQLRAFEPKAAGAGGLVAGAALMAGRRKLVVLISDFLMPEATQSAVFRALARHDIVPVVLTSSAEVASLPRWGLLSLVDLETGRRRLAVLRPSLRSAWLKDAAQRRAALNALAGRYGRRPFDVVDRIDWTGFATHLVEGGF